MVLRELCARTCHRDCRTGAELFIHTCGSERNATPEPGTRIPRTTALSAGATPLRFVRSISRPRARTTSKNRTHSCATAPRRRVRDRATATQRICAALARPHGIERYPHARERARARCPARTRTRNSHHTRKKHVSEQHSLATLRSLATRDAATATATASQGFSYAAQRPTTRIRDLDRLYACARASHVRVRAEF